MSTTTHRPPSTLKTLGAAALLTAAGGLFSQTALAATAADATIRNTVTVTFADTAGNAQTPVQDSVDVLVNLVAAAPALNAPADISTVPGTDAVYNYTITSQANGLDTYDLTAVVTAESAGITGSTATPSAASIALGASTVATSVTIAAATSTAITVPSDQAADGEVNGIAAGDTVVIGGEIFTVDSVTDNGAPPAPPAAGVNPSSDFTSTITVTGANGVTANVGDIIGEQGTFDVTVSPGTYTGPGDQTITVSTTATSQTDAAQTVSDETITTVQGLELLITKFVRNADTANGTGASRTINGQTFFESGVTGNSGETLEYAIVVLNDADGDGAGTPGGAGTNSDATNVLVTDDIPLFTTFTAGSILFDPGTGTFTAQNDDADGGDAAEFEPSAGTNGTGIVRVYAGAGGNDGGAGFGDGTGGTLGSDIETIVIFQVTIDN